MAQIKDLINFEEVKEVIQINAISNPQEIVSKYVISENLRDNLTELFSQLRQNKHKSVHIVGNYGMANLTFWLSFPLF
jgi:outer membrane protein OmpA-like peptidoglycan-associated protein